jgi:hypothetical protein
MAGMVLETNISNVLNAVKDQEKMADSSVKVLGSQATATFHASQAVAKQAVDIGANIISSISSSFSRNYK